jgi:hypothetical protein
MGFPRLGALFGIVAIAATAFSSPLRADGPAVELTVESAGDIVIAAIPAGIVPSRVAAGPALPSCLIGEGQDGQLDFQIAAAPSSGGGRPGAAHGRCSTRDRAAVPTRARYRAVPFTPDPIGQPGNLCRTFSPDGEPNPAVAADGTRYFGSSQPGGRGGVDLYRARRDAAGYAQPENLGIAINSPAAERDGYVSPDQKVLVFASDRPGGHGGLDLYVSHRVVGGWSPARNLGPAVNGPDDESCPQITGDGQLLIFSRPRGMFQVDAAILDDATP